MITRVSIAIKANFLLSYVRTAKVLSYTKAGGILGLIRTAN